MFVGWQSGRGRLRRFVAGESGGESGVDWRVEWLIVETQKGVRVSESKRAKKVRWVPTTTTLVIVFALWGICLCLCFVRGNTANFF